MACLRSALRGCQPTLLPRSHTQLSLADWRMVDYQRCVCAAREILSGGRGIALSEPTVAEAAETVLGLFQGELLPDFADEWLEPFRLDHHYLRIQALEALAEKFMQVRQPAPAARAAAIAIAAEPFRESAHLWLLRALLAEGNRAQAIMHYEGLRRQLLMELGVTPSFELADLLSRDTACQEEASRNNGLPG